MINAEYKFVSYLQEDRVIYRFVDTRGEDDVRGDGFFVVISDNCMENECLLL